MVNFHTTGGVSQAVVNLRIKTAWKARALQKYITRQRSYKDKILSEKRKACRNKGLTSWCRPILKSSRLLQGAKLADERILGSVVKIYPEKHLLQNYWKNILVDTTGEPKMLHWRTFSKNLGLSIFIFLHFLKNKNRQTFLRHKKRAYFFLK